MRVLSLLKNNRGVAIVAVALLMVVGAILGAAVISQTTLDVQHADRTLNAKQELYLAESAKERAYREIMLDDTFANGGTMSDVPFAGGTYDILVTTLTPDPLVVEIQATGDMRMPGNTDPNQRRRRVTVVSEVIRENVCVWNNAIFGGSGQTGGVVNGNCAIHGSVHLLGDNVGSGNSSIEALDLSGSALVHNNYEGMPPELRALIPDPPTNEDGLETLNAKLRVKNGAVGVSGSSEIGQDQAPLTPLGLKGPMDGIYIETDDTETRWTGNQVVDGVPDPDNVQSDNGTEALYDLGDMVQMPDIGTGVAYESEYCDATYADYDAFFLNEALTIPFSLDLDGTNAAALEVQAQAGAFGAGVVVNVDPVTGIFTISQSHPCPGDPDVAEWGGVNSITYNPNSAPGQSSLTISGMVNIQGDLVIGEKGSTTDLKYSGTGTIYVSGSGSAAGDIMVHSDVLPVTQFPEVDVLGLVAKNKITLAGPGDANLMLAGAFFGQNEIISTKQNQIAGTFVTQYFDMGTNVPKIYQVPLLADNLPPGLPGANPIWVVTGFEERSWRVDMVP
ncbi:MAG: hypothetical protein Kow0099_23270 [Candidatus Abyssubacteria bacterium]